MLNKKLKAACLIALVITCFTMLFFSNPTRSRFFFNQSLPQQSVEVKISVDNTATGIKIPDYFLGLSYEIMAVTDTVDFKTNHTKFINLMNGLGKGTLRLNGYYINYVQWSNQKRRASMEKNRLVYTADTLTTSDLDSLFSFVRKTKWNLILGINHTRSNPNLTNSEINYAWSKGKDIISAFEIGNEPESIFKSNFSTYYQSILPHYQNINKTISAVPLCGPATDHPIEPFFKEYMNSDLVNRLKYITIHDYPITEHPETIYQLLDEKWMEKSNNAFGIVDGLAKARNIRYRVGECNNYGDEGINVADRFASALWGLDYMFTAAKNNALGVTFMGGSRGFTPILIRRGLSMQPQPLYYAMLFFHLVGQGSLIPVNLNSDNPGIKAYAVVGANNHLYVTVINKNINSDAEVMLSAQKRVTNGNLIRLTGPSIASKDSITLGGSSIDKFGNWKASKITSVASQNGKFNFTVPKGSAALITL
ncbi:MAG: putative glycosyl hydrolase [Mucilaginibacter sp.]|nr:putative glycosyl hydrolase [Mucilaginibacter sp.]